MAKREFEKFFVSLSLAGEELQLAVIRRKGRGNSEPMILIPGIGGIKEDFCDIRFFEPFDDREVIAFDLPGCGESSFEQVEKITLEELVDVLRQLLSFLDAENVHLIGHGFGSLVAQKFCLSEPARVMSLCSIEGPYGDEERMFSGLDMSLDDPIELLSRFVVTGWLGEQVSSSFFVSNLIARIEPHAFKRLLTIKDEAQKNGALVREFLSLDVTKMFMYGEQNQDYGFLEEFEAAGLAMSEVPFSGCFPMWSNPSAMWGGLSVAIQLGEGVDFSELVDDSPKMDVSVEQSKTAFPDRHEGEIIDQTETQERLAEESDAEFLDRWSPKEDAREKPN